MIKDPVLCCITGQGLQTIKSVQKNEDEGMGRGFSYIVLEMSFKNGPGPTPRMFSPFFQMLGKHRLFQYKKQVLTILPLTNGSLEILF
jgi:hypothetical protein